MAAKVRGITIEIGGDASGLDKALKDVNSSIKNTQSQLKDVNKLLKLDPGNAELLAQKQELLAKASGEAAKKLETLKKAAKEAEEALAKGEIGEEQYNALKREIVSCESEIKKLEEETKNFGSVTNQQVKAAGERFKEVGDKISSIGKTISVASAAIAAASAACVKYASDAEESANKVEVAFGSSSKEVKAFADTTLESFGIARGTALDMASLFGDMGTSMGLSQKEAAKMSTTLVGLAGDMASFKNVSLETAQNALKGIFTGETESLKGLGVVMNDTTLKTYALENGFGKAYDKMSQSEKVMVRYQYVLDATSNAQGDFARTSDGTANSLRIFQESLKELAETLGSEILPIITPIVQKLTAMIQKISGLPEPVKKIIVVIGMVVAVVGPLLVIIGTVISSIGSIMTIMPGLIASLAGVGTVLTGTVIPAIISVGTAITAFVAANPIILVVIAALGLLALAIYECAKHWDEISAACSSAMNSMKQSVSNTDLAKHVKSDVNEIKSAWQSAGGGIKGAFASAMSATKNYYETILQAMLGISDEQMQKIEDRIKNAFNNVISALKSLPSRFREIMTNCFNAVVQVFNNLVNMARKWGMDLADNFTSGLLKMLNKVSDAATTVAQKLKDILGFSEPKEGPLSNFHTYAPDMIDLWCKGVNDNLYKVTSTANTLAEAMSPNATMTGMQLNQQTQTNNALNSIYDSLGNLNQNTTVNVVLEGDAKGVFRLVRQENAKMVKSTGYHALA